jgi:nanoRNase/pAp phosphatase (c-di-AMP/oligoRNAs hydrolase)
MSSLPKPAVILTHESDLDGLVSGVLLQRLAKKLFGEDIPLEAHHYNSWRQRELKEGSAWVSDFAFESRMDQPDWLIVDHHAHDQEPKRARFIHDLDKSAGLLCYELCQQHGMQSVALDRLVHMNNVSDLFLEKDPDFILANDYANLVKVYGFWNLHALFDGEIERLVDHALLEVMAVKRRVEDPLGFEWSRRNVIAINSLVGCVNTTIGNTNQIVYQLLEHESNPFKVLVTLFRRANGIIIASLRSRHGEAITVAERLQGGGHANACGATLPRSVRTIPDAIDHLKKVLNPVMEQEDALNSLESLFDAMDAQVQSRR